MPIHTHEYNTKEILVDMSVSPMITKQMQILDMSVSPMIMNKYRVTYDHDKIMEKMDMSVSPMIMQKKLDML